ncbi:cation channel sperm-associated protein subunit zeta isoform X2 [Cervus canadensis]|uniref:cation channel sperm-associated protein subunit zeta isoform X2 n=1 Tax=Cervus canadensis TaxID=1574408 RepID=UPI001CA36A14|nr:cation channel sperm-associated protein subunit zeta isoform X2 [Cervus canadensis]
MEGKPFKVRTLPGSPHPAGPQAHPGPLTVLSLSPGSRQLPTITPHLYPPSPPHPPPPAAGACRPWLGSGSLFPACSLSLPDSPRPSASLVVCGPQASAKSSSHHGSGRSSLHDIRSMWSTATLSQPKLNVQLPTVREDSELEDFSVSGETRWSYDQKAGHDAEGGWEASDGGEDKDRFNPEEPELGGDSSQGSRLEEDASKTDAAPAPD